MDLYRTYNIPSDTNINNSYTIQLQLMNIKIDKIIFVRATKI